MKYLYTVAVSSLAALFLSGCLSSSDSAEGTVLQDGAGVVDDNSVWFGQVCEAPIYAQLLGYYEGQFSRAEGTRDCSWDVTAEFTGTSFDALCIVTGDIQSTVTYQLPDLTPYTCATMNSSFNLPTDVSVTSLDTLVVPQNFVVNFDNDAVLQVDESGIPLFYPVSDPAPVALDENLHAQFEFGTLTRISDASPTTPE